MTDDMRELRQAMRAGIWSAVNRAGKAYCDADKLDDPIEQRRQKQKATETLVTMWLRSLDGDISEEAWRHMRDVIVELDRLQAGKASTLFAPAGQSKERLSPMELRRRVFYRIAYDLLMAAGIGEAEAISRMTRAARRRKIPVPDGLLEAVKNFTNDRRCDGPSWTAIREQYRAWRRMWMSMGKRRAMEPLALAEWFLRDGLHPALKWKRAPYLQSAAEGDENVDAQGISAKVLPFNR